LLTSLCITLLEHWKDSNMLW